MSSEPTRDTITVVAPPAAAIGPCTGKEEWKHHKGERHIHREDVRKIWKECSEESFWYRALPFSLGSMAVTGVFLSNGMLKKSARFGPFPKLAVAGILGFAVGKASYLTTCKAKFRELGLDGPGAGPWAGRGHRCHHVCEDCKKKALADAPAEQVQS